MSSDSTIVMQQDNISTDLFVGRKTEQDLYAKLLSENTPWVLMITGLGGIGKSTLLNTLYTNTPSEICIVTFDFADRSLRTESAAFIRRLATETYRRCNIQQNGETTNNFQNYIQQLAILSTKSSLQISESESVTEEIRSNQNELDELTSHEIYYQLRGLVTEAFYDQLEILPLYGGPLCQDRKIGSTKSYFPTFQILFVLPLPCCSCVKIHVSRDLVIECLLKALMIIKLEITGQCLARLTW